MFRVKLIILGPIKSGKTVLSNFLADATDISGKEYHATHGSRILEFESGELNISGKNSKADIELWDCSGDKKFESCWPAIVREANGIIYIYNPDQSSHKTAIEFWRSVAGDIPDSHCLLLSNEKPNSNALERINLSDHFSNMISAEIDMDQNPNGIHKVFTSYLEHLLGKLADGRDQDELNIMSESRVS